MSTKFKESSLRGLQRISNSFRREKRQNNTNENKCTNDSDSTVSSTRSNKPFRRSSFRRSFRKKKVDERLILSDLNNILKLNEDDGSSLEQSKKTVLGPRYQLNNDSSSIQMNESFSTVLSRKPTLPQTYENKINLKEKEKKTMRKTMKRIFNHMFRKHSTMGNGGNDLSKSEIKSLIDDNKENSKLDDNFKFESLYMPNQKHARTLPCSETTNNRYKIPAYLNILHEVDPQNAFDTEVEMLGNEGKDNAETIFLSTVWNIWNETITESYDSNKKKILYNLHFYVSMKVYKLSHIQKANTQYESILKPSQKDDTQIFICRYGIKPGGHGIFSEGLRIILNVPNSLGEQMWSITNKLLFTDDMFCLDFDLQIFAVTWKKRGSSSEDLVLCYWVSHEEKDPSCIASITKMLANFYPQQLRGLFQYARYFFNTTRESGSIAL